MVDYMKFKHASPVSWKSKKFDGSRYKEYLYGSVQSLDTEWADKIVDFNPDLKVDTNGFSKYVDRNTSMSTDCGFDFSSSLASNHDSTMPDDTSLKNYDSVQGGFQPEGRLVLNTHPKDSPPNLDDYSVAGSEKFVDPQAQKFAELQKQYKELSLKFEQLKKEHEGLATDAEMYRSCKERMNIPKLDFEPESDPKQSLELLLDQIYSILTDTFGADNTLSVYLEKFANLYLTHQNQVELELTALRSKAQVVESFEKLVSERKNYDRLLEQRDKTIESLVEELKNSKADHSTELNTAREELDSVRNNLDSRVQELEEQVTFYKEENARLEESLTAHKDQYKKLLSDQHEILSQLPLATLQVAGGVENLTSADTFSFGKAENWQAAKPDANAWTKLTEGWAHNSPNVWNNSNTPTWPRSSTETLKYTSPQNWTRNNTDTWQGMSEGSWSRVQTSTSTARPEDVKQDKLWPTPSDRPRDMVEPVDTTPSRRVDNEAFLQSLLQALYKKNEEALETINKKDAIIRKQSEAISRLQNSVKEWESDAVLWLDYVEQSSSLLRAE